MEIIATPAAIEQLVVAHPIFGEILNQFGPPPNWQRPQGFETLSKIIIEQQVSLASAAAHFKRLKEFLVAFTPENLLLLTDLEMRSCQISRQKTSYLRALAEAVVTKKLDLHQLSTLSNTEIKEKLTRIKGIGTWTAEVYLLFALQKKDIFPLGDIALLNAIKAVTPATTKPEIEALVANWSPNKSLAAFFLWHFYLRSRNRDPLF